jgi:hypothetical protein
MPHRVNDDLGLRDLIENEIGIRGHDQPSDGGIVGAGADTRVTRQKIDQRLNALLDAPGALR